MQTFFIDTMQTYQYNQNKGGLIYDIWRKTKIF